MAEITTPYDGPVVTRPEALAAGLKRYFSGAPCKAGHIAERFVSNRHCIDCNAEWSIAHPDIAKYHRAKYAKLNPERIRATGKRYIETHKEDVAKRSREWRLKNLDRAKKRKSAWSQANKDTIRSYVRNRRARLRGSTQTHSSQDIAALLERQRGKCAHRWCRVALRGKYHVDHVMPIALGGSNGARNLQLLCAPCNQSKSSLHPVDFALRNGLLV